METKNLVTSVVMLAVVVMLTATILVPVIDDAKISTATVENYENESTLLSLAEANDTVTVEYSSSTLAINGETVTPTTNSNMVLSNVFSLDTFYYNSSWLYRAWVENGTTLIYPSAISLTFTDGTVTGTYTVSSTEYEIDDSYDYLFYADEDGDYVQIGSNTTISAYINDDADVVLSGLYYTGDNDTTYAYVDGVMTTYADYESSVAITKTLVDGTLDVYQMTGLVVTIGEETFTPFRIIVPAEVTGHENGTYAQLFSIIPVLVIVGIVVAAIGIAYTRRD